MQMEEKTTVCFPSHLCYNHFYQSSHKQKVIMLQKWYNSLTLGHKILVRVVGYVLGPYIILTSLFADSWFLLFLGLALILLVLYLDLGKKKSQVY